MEKEKLIKILKKEIKAIEKEYDVSDWEYCDVSRMTGDEAFTRGFYRAYQSIIEII